jgi:hypothetical protein
MLHGWTDGMHGGVSASELRRKFVMAHGGSLDAVSLPDVSVHTGMSGFSGFTALTPLTPLDHDANPAGKRKTSKSLKFAPMHDDQSEGMTSAVTEITFEEIEEKLRKKTGEKQVWTEKKARDLANTH